MVTLMDERMTFELGKFSGFSSFTLTMPYHPTEGVATYLYNQPGHKLAAYSKMLLLSYCPSKLKEKMLYYLDANCCPAVQDAKDYKMLQGYKRCCRGTRDHKDQQQRLIHHFLANYLREKSRLLCGQGLFHPCSYILRSFMIGLTTQ